MAAEPSANGLMKQRKGDSLGGGQTSRAARLCAAVVEMHAHRISFHVATADDEHRANALLLGVGGLRLEQRGAVFIAN